MKKIEVPTPIVVEMPAISTLSQIVDVAIAHAEQGNTAAVEACIEIAEWIMDSDGPPAAEYIHACIGRNWQDQND